MTELTQDLSLAQACSLIDSYAFDLGGDDTAQLLEYWLDLYHPGWIRLATIEALYLGRYKAISIEHILSVWLRLGTPNPHFSYEFERLICRKLPKHLSDLATIPASAPKISDANFGQISTEVKPTPIKEQPIDQSSVKKSQELSDASFHSHIQDSTQRRLHVEHLKGTSSAKTDKTAFYVPASDLVENDAFEESLNLDNAFGNLERASKSNQSLMSAIGFSYQSHWSEFAEGNKMIHQFIPLPDVSSFFLKLKTFGESK